MAIYEFLDLALLTHCNLDTFVYSRAVTEPLVSQKRMLGSKI